MQEMLALILTENSVFQGTQRNLWLRDLFLVCVADKEFLM